MGRSRQGRGKFHPRTGHEGPERETYSSTLSLTSALGGGGWSMLRPGRVTPGKYSLYRRLDGPQGRPGRLQDQRIESIKHKNINLLDAV
jgi:hypothetical protein